LAGSTALFSWWAHQAIKDQQVTGDDAGKARLSACMAACTLVRETNRRAFEKHHRATTTSNMLEEVAQAFRDLFEPKCEE